MSVTAFPVNDLLRRKLQTSLTIISLTLCVASTLFLLAFSEKMGFGIFFAAESKLTAGFSVVFSRFIIFVALLIFAIGSVIASFLVFVMMSQRIKEIGLMKAAGCPNNLIFGYFATELLIITFVSCLFGTVLGVIADFASVNLLKSFGFAAFPEQINFWLVLIVFAIYFFLTLVFGIKPILDTVKIEPANAISPTYYLGLVKEQGFKIASKGMLTWKIALRNLFRHKSATIRIVICLSTVFIIVTVGIAGGIIADQTTKSWVEKAVGRNTILIAHEEFSNNYRALLLKFYEASEYPQFNYTNQKYFFSEDALEQLNSIVGIKKIDLRLILQAHVEEVQGYILREENGATITVGDSRKGESLIIGVNPKSVISEWFIDGEFLKNEHGTEALIGDTLAQKMFSFPLNQSIRLFNKTFDIVGTCIDFINNGNVTYIPLKTLQDITGISKPNAVIVQIEPSEDYKSILNNIKAAIQSLNPEFEVFELNEALEKNLNFMGYIWSTIMFLPLSTLIVATLCMTGFVALTLAEQRQELGVLRALGAKPKTIVKIVSIQSFVVLLSGFAVGISFGTIITLLILVPNPVITTFTVFEIGGWLTLALIIIFVFSFYPSIKFSRQSIIKSMT